MVLLRGQSIARVHLLRAEDGPARWRRGSPHAGKLVLRGLFLWATQEVCLGQLRDQSKTVLMAEAQCAPPTGDRPGEETRSDAGVTSQLRLRRWGRSHLL